MKTTGKITSETDYNATMTEIDQLMAKGSKNSGKEELSQIRSLALKAQAYEQQKFVIEPPPTFFS